jgi:TRAP-type C4-dicarboxylate transport system permease small subunit
VLKRKDSRVEKFVNVTGRIWKYVSYAAMVCLIANVLIIIANIIMRRFFGAPIWGSTEYVKYLSLVGASFALVQNEWFDGNIRMTLLPEKIPQAGKNVLTFIVNLVCSVAFVYISYLLVLSAYSKYLKWDISPDLQLPIFWFVTILAIGFIILTIGLICKTIISAHTLRTGQLHNLRNVRTLEQE